MTEHVMKVVAAPEGGPYKSWIYGTCGCLVFKTTAPPEADHSTLEHQVRGHEEVCDVAP